VQVSADAVASLVNLVEDLRKEAFHSWEEKIKEVLNMTNAINSPRDEVAQLR
jgi:hypothetical protein